MKRHKVCDGDRTLVFTGRMLGESSSHEPGRTNWTEARIFMTTAGNYVVEIVGKTSVPGQVDRCRAQVCETARGAVESLYLLDEDRVRYIPRVNREAAVQAAHVDEAFSQAYFVEEVA